MNEIFTNNEVLCVCQAYANEQYCYFPMFVENLEYLLNKGEKICKVEGNSMLTTKGRMIKFTEVI